MCWTVARVAPVYRPEALPRPVCLPIVMTPPGLRNSCSSSKLPYIGQREGEIEDWVKTRGALVIAIPREVNERPVRIVLSWCSNDIFTDSVCPTTGAKSVWAGPLWYLEYICSGPNGFSPCVSNIHRDEHLEIATGVTIYHNWLTFQISISVIITRGSSMLKLIN